MSVVLLSLGSNLGDRVKNISDAALIISEKAGKVITHSQMYESKAWGVQSPHDYINSCILIETNLSPREMLDIIHTIEGSLGRSRGRQYSDRTIDIDILLFENNIIDEDGLNIPHPRMHERLFVLVPANQIVPTLEHPVFKKSVQQLLLECPDESNVYEYKISSGE